METFFKQNLTFLKNKTGKTQAEIGLQLNKNGNTVGYWEKGKGEPSATDLGILSKYFDISIDDLIFRDLANGNLIAKSDTKKNEEKGNLKGNRNGNLMPILGTDDENTEPAQKSLIRMPQVVTVDTSGDENTVMVPVRARAGYLNGYEDPEYISTLPAYRLPGFRNGTFRMFEVDGISMHPTFNDKDIIITQFVENLSQLRDDRVYVVVTKNHGVVVKRVLNRIEKDNVLILKSDNTRHKEEYPVIVLQPEDVLEIWYGVATMSRQMRAPGEMYVKLNDQEARLTLIEEKLKKLLE